MSAVPAIRAVAFDVDGTLYSEPLLYLRSVSFALAHRRTIAAFRAIRAHLHNPMATQPDDIRQWQARQYAQQRSVSLVAAHRRIDAVIYERWMHKICRMPLLPQVPELLAFLQARGLSLAVLSDFPARQKLEHWGIASYFHVVHNSESGNRLKPHARPFEWLAHALSCPPRAILYVGNNPRYDIAPAHALGFRTAYYRDPLAHVLCRPAAQVSPASDVIFSHYRVLHTYLQQHL